ncbi:MAG: peptidyl-prolyl cis-trans isomerase, partial [Bacteroidetes bacterium]|nr:peptidyl-prolyl cis-trans isomerase [Bacteroidota bacterium]
LLPMKTVLLLIAPFIFWNQTLVTKATTGYIVAKKDARKLAEYYRQRVLKGESMSSIAMLYSEDPGSSANGGQYNHVVKGMMVPEFEKVAFALKPGEISEVFETQYGFHFIQLISRKGDVLDLRHVLITKD